MPKILLIEDDFEVAQRLVEYLQILDMEVTHFDDPYMGLSALNVDTFDLVVLDLTLPGMDGIEVCEKIVSSHPIPVIIASARDNLDDKVDLLKMGAEDYVQKPYDPKELEARIQTVLRRWNRIGTKTVVPNREDPFHIDAESMEISFQNEKLQLTQAEYGILAYLYQKKGRVVSREELLNNVAGLSCDSTNKSVDVIVFRLRQKMEPNPKDPHYIKSIRGAGYKLLV